MKLFVCIALVFLSLHSFAKVRPAESKWCSSHLPFGAPVSQVEGLLICREGYALQHYNQARIPAWVAYVLTPREANGCAARTSRFRPEPSLAPGSRAETKDYSGSGYDIGHFANNGDMRWSELVETESNVLSNAAPMRPTLNRGPWARLEDVTRVWAIERGPILIYTGPIFHLKFSPRIGQGVVVPDAFFKVLVDLQAGEAIAFIYPAWAARGEMDEYRASIQQVERYTGISLPLPKGVKQTSTWRLQSGTSRDDRAAACEVGR